MKTRLLALLLTLAMLCTLFPLTALATEAETLLFQASAADVEVADNDTLFEGYLTQLFYGDDGISTVGDFGSTDGVFTEDEYAIYTALKEAVAEIAAGNRTSTQITTPYSQSYTASDLGLSSSATRTQWKNAAATAYLANIDMTKIMECLLVDCPYECYWFDKTSYLYGCTAEYSTSGSTVTGITLHSLTFYLTVASAYQGSSSYTVDTTAITQANTALANAQAVLETTQDLNDLEKLYAYSDAICALVSYNDDAVADDYADGYGDPWQLIYVFDGDDTTNVVCEGYTKAFQYLCDLGLDYTTCYTVAGNGHMWNIVELCGRRYLIDVTNSDEGCLGSDGELFLLDATQAYSYTAGTSYVYRITVGRVIYAITYSYSSSYINLYAGTDVLTLSTAEDGYTHTNVLTDASCTELTYTCAACGEVTTLSIEDGHTPGESVAENYLSPTCTEAGSYDLVTCCADCGVELSRQSITLSATGHSTVTDSAVSPTCTETGLTEGSHCSVCGLVFTQQTTLDALGHTWAATDWDGSALIYTCTTCGTTQRVTDVDFMIFRNPEDVSAAIGSTATFIVVATGQSMTYEWQFSVSGTKWYSCAASTFGDCVATDTLLVTATAGRNGYQYRCKVTNGDGTVLYSDAATLTTYQAVDPIVIQTQPGSYTGPTGTTATFTVEAISNTGSALSYQWQFSSSGTKWYSCAASAFGDCVSTATLEIPIISGRNGYQYRCIITDAAGNTVTSEIATLTVGTATSSETVTESLAITAQPVSYTGPVGTTATFTVTATGTGLSYQWQFSSNGTKWYSCASSAFGDCVTTATLEIPIISGRNGYQYRCVITDAAGNTVTSEVATLTVGTATSSETVTESLAITAQPVSYTGAVGTTATFTVTATGTGLSYQWQFSSNGTKWYSCSSSAFGDCVTTATLEIPIISGRNGYQYRCIITDAAGNTVTSEVATLTVG